MAYYLSNGVMMNSLQLEVRLQLKFHFVYYLRWQVGKVQLNALLYSGIKTNLQKNSIVAIFHTMVIQCSYLDIQLECLVNLTVQRKKVRQGSGLNIWLSKNAIISCLAAKRKKKEVVIGSYFLLLFFGILGWLVDPLIRFNPCRSERNTHARIL